MENIEIKFRIYNKNAKDFIRENQNRIAIFDLILWAQYAAVNRLENLDGLIVQKFTGLLDKNGKEIFEGDIISCYSWFTGTERKPRKKQNIEVALEFVTSITPEVCGGYEGEQLYKEVEVIGNIFENPELLKK